jgi:integrase
MRLYGLSIFEKNKKECMERPVHPPARKLSYRCNVRMIVRQRAILEDQDSVSPITTCPSTPVQSAWWHWHKEYAGRWLATAKDQLAATPIVRTAYPSAARQLESQGNPSMRREETARREAQDTRKNTVRLLKAALSTLLSQAVEEEIMALNPTLGRFRESRSSGSSRQSDVNPMSHEQLARFKHTVERLVAEGLLPTGVGMGFLMMAGTGLRPSELMALRPNDVEIPARTVRIERVLDLDGQIKLTKAEETRLVDLSARLAAALSNYLTLLDTEAMWKRTSELVVC